MVGIRGLKNNSQGTLIFGAGKHSEYAVSQVSKCPLVGDLMEDAGDPGLFLVLALRGPEYTDAVSTQLPYILKQGLFSLFVEATLINT